MVKKDQVKKTKKGDAITIFWYTLKNFTLSQVNKNGAKQGTKQEDV